MERQIHQLSHLQRILDFPAYQEFQTTGWKAIARKQTSQCNVRRLLARRVLVSILKDLGVFLDQCLSFDEHIRKTVASCMNKPIQIDRIVLGLHKYDHISAGLRSLWRLNVKQRLMVDDAVWWCINVLTVCHLATCQINFQFELLSMIDRQDIDIFHLAESMLADALFITVM